MNWKRQKKRARVKTKSAFGRVVVPKFCLSWGWADTFLYPTATWHTPYHKPAHTGALHLWGSFWVRGDCLDKGVGIFQVNVLFQLPTMKKKWKASSPSPSIGERKGSFPFLKTSKWLRQSMGEETWEGKHILFPWKIHSITRVRVTTSLSWQLSDCLVAGELYKARWINQ